MAVFSEDVYQPETLNQDAARTVLILTADGVEDLEFFYPYYRFIEAGFKVDVATPQGSGFKCKQGLGLKKTRKISEINAEDYVVLYIPGGKAPAELKTNKNAVELVQRFVTLGKPIAAICHGPQLLAIADVIKGRKLAAWPEIEGEIIDAGGAYENKEMVVDGLFVTARWPGDLPAHMRKVLSLLGESAGTLRAIPAAA